MLHALATPSRVVSTGRATELDAGRPAEPNTPLDFDINTKGELDSPFLVLVPDYQAVST